MSALTNPNGMPLTMTSLEISELVESRHDNVKITMERLGARGVIQLPAMQEVKNHLGQTVKVYPVCKRDSYIVVAQLCPEFTARLVDRWQELEAKVATALVPALPATYAEALRSLADQVEETQRAEAQRDEAVRTKALIGSKREATAMATASAAKREVEKLKEELGRNREFATVIAVENATKRELPNNAYVELRREAKANGIDPVDVPDKRYGKVKAWPAIAWKKVFGIELPSIFPGPMGGAH